MVVKAGPFDKATADENMAKLTENGLEGYIYTDKAEKEPEEAPEAVG